MTHYLCELPKVRSRSPIPYILGEMMQPMYSVLAYSKILDIALLKGRIKQIQERCHLFVDQINFVIGDFDEGSLRDDKHQPLQSPKRCVTDSLKSRWKKIPYEEGAEFFCFESFKVFLNISL